MNMKRYPRFLPAGDSALVLEFGNEVSPSINAKIRRMMYHLEKNSIKSVVESIPTYRSLLIHYDPITVSFDDLKKHLIETIQSSEKINLPSPRRMTVPTLYGEEYGEDLKDVASTNGLSPEEVVRIHSGHDFLVYMIGFTLGFPYLGEVPKAIRCPRLHTPRLKVPAGSVGIADNLTGIYPLESPGGWRVIGRTPLKLFDYQQDPPATFRAGDLVRFVPIDRRTFESMLKNSDKGRYTMEDI